MIWLKVDQMELDRLERLWQEHLRQELLLSPPFRSRRCALWFWEEARWPLIF